MNTFNSGTARSSQWVRDIVQEELHAMMNDPLSWPEGFSQALPAHLEVNPPTLPISQITGFTQFTAQAATSITAIDSTSGTGGFETPTTAGPSFANLPNGNYVFLFGAVAKTGDGTSPLYMALSYNSSTPTIAESTFTFATAMTPIGRGCVASLSNGVNTVSAQYRGSAGGTWQMQYRWLIALKYSNL